MARKLSIKTRDVGRNVNIGNNDGTVVKWVAVALVLGVIALGAFALGGRFTATDGETEIVIDDD